MSTPNSEQTPSTPAPGSAEHDAALAASFEARDAAAGQPTPATEPKPERPASVPEKFWDADKGEVKWDAIAALDKPAEPAPEGGEKKPDEAPKSEALKGYEGAQVDATKALEAVGLDYAKFAESFAKNGALTEADYAEMEAKNIPRAVVDAHVKTLQAHAKVEADAITADIQSVVGGAAQYGELLAWARTNLSAADAASFDKVVDTGSVDAVKMAVQNLQGKMTAARGQEPNLLSGGNGGAVLDVFESTAQLTDAMKDPRYGRDPAYRKAIEAKLARSNIM